MFVPVASASGIGFHKQVANFPAAHEVVVIVNDLRLESRKDLSARARPNLSRDIGNHHMQGFRGTDGVKDLHSKTLSKSQEYRGRKGLASRDAMAHGRQIKLSPLRRLVRQQPDVIGG